MIKLRINKLKFDLDPHLLDASINNLNKLTHNLSELAAKAGTENEAFNRAYTSLEECLNKNLNIEEWIGKAIDVRALSYALQTQLREKIDLTSEIFEKIGTVKPKTSNVLIESVYEYYLLAYDNLKHPREVELWLLDVLKDSGQRKDFHEKLLCADGPKWLAESCESGVDFSTQLERYDLDNYSQGRFLNLAQDIYFVHQLKIIPANKPHALLTQVQNPNVYNSKYGEDHLLGHEILKIIIERSPNFDIHESWLNVILSIAGDPRVPRTHQNYIKWWSSLDQSLHSKVKAWLSGLDLKLFLEALNDYAKSSYDDELQRMYPSRKTFLEGLLNKKLILNTRLFLSQGAISYLHRYYPKEHLPNYSVLYDSDKSIIHVELSGAHLVEGSHSCYLWVYRHLSEGAAILDPNKKRFTYSSLTSDLNRFMVNQGMGAVANIPHNPTNFAWQYRAIRELRALGVNISAQDVLSDRDYSTYLRTRGSSY